MALYDFGKDGLQKIPEATMADLKIRERQDLQEVLRTHIEAVAPGVLVIYEEYPGWEDNHRHCRPTHLSHFTEV
jgi:hypothetical protein